VRPKQEPRKAPYNRFVPRASYNSLELGNDTSDVDLMFMLAASIISKICGAKTSATKLESLLRVDFLVV